MVVLVHMYFYCLIVAIHDSTNLTCLLHFLSVVSIFVELSQRTTNPLTIFSTSYREERADSNIVTYYILSSQARSYVARKLLVTKL